MTASKLSKGSFDLGRREFLRTAAMGIAAMMSTPLLGSGVALGAGKTLSIAIPNNPTTFDPLNQTNHDAMVFSQTIFENLLEVDLDGEIKPMLAKTLPKISDDKKTYWFDLRDDVYFQNGQKFTAEDVKYSYEYILNPENKAARRGLWTAIKGIVVESPTRVRFELDAPYRPMTQIMTKYMGIFPKGSREEHGSTFFQTGPIGVGTGPGIFVEARQNDYVEFKRNPKYWRKGVPAWERLIIRIIPEDAVRVAYLMTNQVQIISAPPPKEFMRIKNMPGFTGDSQPTNGFLHMELNNKKPPFDDVNFRRALQMGINREQIARDIYYGLIDPTAIPASPRFWWFNKEANDLNAYNKDKAREFLAKSKYPTGAEFDLVISAQPYLLDVKDTALVVQSQLAELGIKVNIRLLETGQLLKLMGNGDHVAAMMPMMGPPDPTYQILVNLTPGQVMSKASNYNSDELNAALGESYRVVEKTDLKPIYDRIMMILAKDSPYIWLGAVHAANLWRAKTEGFKVNMGLTMRVRDVIPE